MNLQEQWKNLTESKKTPEEQNSFWTNYLEQEKLAYEDILGNNKKVISGKVEEIAKAFNMDAVTFAGFID